MGFNYKPSQPKRESKLITYKMSEWVCLDITSFTKTTKKDKILKILKDAKVDVCEISDPYQSELRNKPTITITVKRAHYEDENKTPDYPGSWIIEEDYSKQPAGGALL